MCHMAREFEVCQECYRNCLVIHGEKRVHSRKILTFFKVMFGKNNSELLIVPPKFSRTFTSLVGKKSFIEDSSGQRWKVVLSNVEGSLAFKKGWNNFYRGNGIEQGDFLVFHYVKDSHFIVTIYGRSGYEKEKPVNGKSGFEKQVHGRSGSEKRVHGISGYEKPVPAECSHQSKKLKSTSDSTIKKYSSDSLFDERESPQKSDHFNNYVPRSDTDSIPSQDDQSNVKKLLVEADVLMEPCILNDKETASAKENDLTNSLLVAENAPKTDILMEPCFLTDKEATFAKEDDREHLLDLSNYELPDKKPIIEDHLMNFPDSSLANNKEYVMDDNREHLFVMPSIKLSDINSISSMKGDENYLSELPPCNLTEKKVDANSIGELQVQGNTFSEVLGALHKYQPVDASIDLAKKTGIDMPSIELPDVNSSFAKIGDENILSDLSTLKLTDEKVDANEIGELQGNTGSQVLETLNKYQPGDASIDLAKETKPDMPPIELPDVNSSYTQKVDENYLSDLSTLELTDKKVDANNIDELQVQGNPCSEVLGALHEGQPENAYMDLAKKASLSEANSVLPSMKIEAKPSESECIQAPSVSPRVSMPLDSAMPPETIMKIDTLEPSAASSHSLLPGDTIKVVKQEPKDFGQGLFDTVVDDPSFGVKSEEPREGDVNPVSTVKTEPVDICDSDSASTIRIKCSIPPDSESFLVLPESLPLKRGHNLRVRQKLISLRNSAGEDWPVIYFNTYYKVLASGWNAFRKANNICSGDECVFVLDSLDKGIFRVEIPRR